MAWQATNRLDLGAHMDQGFLNPDHDPDPGFLDEFFGEWGVAQGTIDYIQGDHLSGKPGNVRELYMSGKCQEFT